MDALNTANPEAIRVWWAGQTDRRFHATFSARWRRYIYLFPLNAQQHSPSTEIQLPVGDKPQDSREFDVDVHMVQAVLVPLVGQRLDYYAFARDTPAGKNCECTILKCDASLVDINLDRDSQTSTATCLCVEVRAVWVHSFIQRHWCCCIDRGRSISATHGSCSDGHCHSREHS